MDEKEKKIFEIFVNGTRKNWEGNEISFSQVVNLAFDGKPPNANGEMFTVIYSRGGNEKKTQGSLTEGESVKIKDGMRFDVTATNKS